MKCGGCSLFGFGDFAPFCFLLNLPFVPWTRPIVDYKKGTMPL